MMNKFVNDWLETGFTEISGISNVVRCENSLIPILKNEKGENQTPKPLFSSFSNESQLEPEFLPKYLLVLEKKFRDTDSINLNEYASEDTGAKDLETKVPEGERILIEYDRKSIFLSRVMFNLFEMPDSSVLKGSAEYPKVVEKNEMYQNALDRRRTSPESYKEQCVQTEFIDTVDKEIETVAMICKSKTCMINNYLFNEHYDRNEMDMKPSPKTFTEFFNAKTKFYDYNGFLSTISIHPDICNRVQETLYITEKILDYNTFDNSILEFNGCQTDMYRLMTENFTESKTKLQEKEETDSRAQTSNRVVVKHHLTFYLEKLKNDFSVTCVECSPFNPNIFVAGYGVTKDDEKNYEHRGFFLCWNINKCGYPEKIYRTEEIVTCLEFSKSEQYLVAVGMRYGLISIFYLQKPITSASANNFFSKVRPNGTIKNIRWFKKKFGMGEQMDMLLSVSTDSIICSWKCVKQLDGSVLRHIKRGDMKHMVDVGKRLVIAVDTTGMCMQFKPGTNDRYLIGTVEGEALLADINDPDSYKQVYKCHNGPLYDLQWSPFLVDVFMTTGTDKSIHIWEMGKKKPPKSLRLKENVLKVVWSHIKSTLFAALCKTKILIFDLSVDFHSQIAQYTAKENTTFTCLNFCPKNNWILIGQSNGSIELLELCNILQLETNQEDALRKTFMSDD